MKLIAHGGDATEAGCKGNGADLKDETIFIAHDYYLARVNLAAIWRRIVALRLCRERMSIAF